MSATVAAALKKIAVAILTNPKVLKTIGGIVLGIIIIIIMPIVAVVSIFNGDINIDTDRLQTMVVENLSAEEKAKLQFVENTMYAIEDEMTAAGFDDQRVKEAQVLYVLALSDYAAEDGFVSKLVGCFTQGQSDAQLIGRMLDSTVIDKDGLKNRIFECASLVYSELDTAERTTEHLRAVFESTRPLSCYNPRLTEQAVSAVILHTDKTVSLILKNGQEIRKEKTDAATDTSTAEAGTHHSANRSAGEYRRHTSRL